ncbi:MAG: oxygen-independent coproporphyrinogen III oxidase [Asticcacaulis sp.]
MLRWLGRQAPRYTSYPSADRFEALTPDIHAQWLERLPRGKSIGLYVHVPFCEQMCWFCGCNTQITRRYEPVEAYVDSLIEEVRLVSRTIGFRPKAHALHFGGGSPGLLTPASMQRLFGALNAAFDLQPGAEISIELDPRRVTAEKAQSYGALGFNRVSLGVQDTQAEVQAAINRLQPMEVLNACVGYLREAGLTELGIDLVYGLPHQTADGLTRTLDDVDTLNPARISAFSYAHVPWARKHQRLIDETALPDVAARTRQYLQIETHLKAAGYIPVGMDHFARPDDGLARAQAEGRLRRNFMGYTDLPNDTLVALGASSISQLEDGIVQNVPQATTYASRIAEGRLPTVRGWLYRDDDAVRAEVIMRLMCDFRVALPEVLARHGLPDTYFDDEIAALAEFTAAGLVEVRGRTVVFDAPLKMLVRPVACVFDRYAREGVTGNRYSRVA